MVDSTSAASADDHKTLAGTVLGEHDKVYFPLERDLVIVNDTVGLTERVACGNRVAVLCAVDV